MMVHSYRCPCEKTEVHYLKREGDLSCSHCGGELERKGTVGCVRGLKEGQTPNQALQELAEDWWDQTENIVDWNDYNEGAHDAMKSCSEELLKLLSQYDDSEDHSVSAETERDTDE